MDWSFQAFTRRFCIFVDYDEDRLREIAEEKILENSWQTALELGKKVKVEIKPTYLGSGKWPVAFEVDEWIDGIKVTPKKTFEN